MIYNQNLTTIVQCGMRYMATCKESTSTRISCNFFIPLNALIGWNLARVLHKSLEKIRRSVEDDRIPEIARECSRAVLINLLARCQNSLTHWTVGLYLNSKFESLKLSLNCAFIEQNQNNINTKMFEEGNITICRLPLTQVYSTKAMY